MMTIGDHMSPARRTAANPRRKYRDRWFMSVWKSALTGVNHQAMTTIKPAIALP